MSVKYAYWQDLTDDQRWAADLLQREAPYAAQCMEINGVTHGLLQLADHLPTREPFMVVAMPDGPYLAVLPLTPGAEALLMREIQPCPVAWTKSGVAEWANRQRWEPTVGIAIRLVGADEWETYDPRELGGIEGAHDDA